MLYTCFQTLVLCKWLCILLNCNYKNPVTLVPRHLPNLLIIQLTRFSKFLALRDWQSWLVLLSNFVRECKTNFTKPSTTVLPIYIQFYTFYTVYSFCLLNNLAITFHIHIETPWTRILKWLALFPPLNTKPTLSPPRHFRLISDHFKLSWKPCEGFQSYFSERLLSYIYLEGNSTLFNIHLQESIRSSRNLKVN